ncbi:spore coat CotO family protein [Bacillus timonensis]|nr:spore coat CotO family protein [Bacillus timonensis]
MNNYERGASRPKLYLHQVNETLDDFHMQRFLFVRCNEQICIEDVFEEEVEEHEKENDKEASEKKKKKKKKKKKVSKSPDTKTHPPTEKSCPVKEDEDHVKQEQTQDCVETEQKPDCDLHVAEAKEFTTKQRKVYNKQSSADELIKLIAKTSAVPNRKHFSSFTVREKIEFLVNLPKHLPATLCEIKTRNTKYVGVVHAFDGNTVTIYIVYKRSVYNVNLEEIEDIYVIGF